MNDNKEAKSMKDLATEIANLIKVLQEQTKPVTYLPHDLEYFTIQEVAGVLNCSQNTVRSILKEYEIKIFQYKGIIRVRKTHLEKFLNKHTI
ncbi:helix-turn-helix domain-containing protein [Pedobacter panaciterrae]